MVISFLIPNILINDVPNQSKYKLKRHLLDWLSENFALWDCIWDRVPLYINFQKEYFWKPRKILFLDHNIALLFKLTWL